MPASPATRTRWLHWGRTGAGPVCLTRLADLAETDAGAKALSFTLDTEITDELATSTPRS